MSRMNVSVSIAAEMDSLTVITPRSMKASLMMSLTDAIGPSQLLRLLAGFAAILSSFAISSGSASGSTSTGSAG